VPITLERERLACRSRSSKSGLQLLANHLALDCQAEPMCGLDKV